ncbi:uncharacterized protein LOC109838288 [Asparagus officinalis]|uniref:uncharacterized protein LOC109838288 n=1 Tax=Asparagus officinalis TaxID=4686 RepID=UPI00098E25D6|nr:uncharacterized protein LOC109838288 [Asparagus officinalis]
MRRKDVHMFPPGSLNREHSVSKEEIKRAVFSMPDNKSPDPDGYGASFFKSAWSVIGDEVTLAIEVYFKTGKLLGAINSTSITLIPKKIYQHVTSFSEVSGLEANPNKYAIFYGGVAEPIKDTIKEYLGFSEGITSIR